jgi:hypothetical protein
MVLPMPLRRKFGLLGEAEWRVEMVGDRLELTPETPEDYPSVVREKGLLVVSSTGRGCDAVEALRAQREDREDAVTGRAENPAR